MNSALNDKLLASLWPAGTGPETATVYAIVDCARHPDIFQMVQSTPLFKACLFAGKMSQAMLAAAPQIVKLAPDASFTKQLLESGWGNSWGIFVTAARPAGIEDVRRQLRQFLLVKDPEGKKLFFRYYDPRVMRVYLPTCNKDECDVLFHPIVKYLMESETGAEIVEFDRNSILDKSATFAPTLY